MLHVECNSCSARYRVKPESLGKRFRCKNCGALIKVTQQVGQGVAAEETMLRRSRSMEESGEVHTDEFLSSTVSMSAKATSSEVVVPRKKTSNFERRLVVTAGAAVAVWVVVLVIHSALPSGSPPPPTPVLEKPTPVERERVQLKVRLNPANDRQDGDGSADNEDLTSTTEPDKQKDSNEITDESSAGMTPSNEMDSVNDAYGATSVTSLQPESRLHMNSVETAAIAFSRDGKLGATVGFDNAKTMLRVFGLPEANVVALNDCRLTSNSVAFSPDGTQVVYGRPDGAVSVFDLSRGETVA